MYKLTDPITIKTLLLKNRLVMPPMATAKADEEGQITEEVLAYYREKSSGGHLGLLITEHNYVSPEGKAHKGHMSIARDADIAGHRRLVEAIHANNTLVFAQINHGGIAASTKITGMPVLGPSPVNRYHKDEMPVEMTTEDIRRITADFASAAVRIKEAGYDGVEIHAAHGYLLNQFFSPLTNQRTDEYGSDSLVHRLRLLLEVVAAVRSAIGNDYPLAVRLGACDYRDGGITKEEGIQAAKQLAEAGVDLLDISGGLCGFMRPDSRKPGYFGELAAAIKEVVDIPVILTGGIKKRNIADELLAEGKADLIGVGRSILKNSAWAAEAMAQ